MKRLLLILAITLLVSCSFGYIPSLFPSEDQFEVETVLDKKSETGVYRFLVLTDGHFGRDDSGVHHFITSFNDFYSSYEKEIDATFLLGDMMDKTDENCHDLFVDFVKTSLKSKQSVPVIYVLGNHEIEHNDPDYWYDMRNYLDELSEEDRMKSRDSQTMYKEGWPAEKTYAHRCSERAIDYIRSHKDTDFFLVLSYDEPHDPSLCPEPFASMYSDFCLPKRENVWDTLENKPPHQQAWSGPRRFQDRDDLLIQMKELFGCNSFVDSEIGRVTDAAKEILGQDFTLLYTSDHGDMAQSHCLYAKGPSAYEEIAHIPFILWGQGTGVVDTPVSHIDIAATVWDFFGFEKPMMLQGESLLPLVRTDTRPARRDVFIEFGRYEIDHDGFGGWQPMRCIFDGRYKLVINLLSEDELYDLETDPFEMDNLICAEAVSSVRDNLMRRLLAHMDQIRDPFRGYWWEQRPWYTNRTSPSWDYTGYTRQRSEPDYEAPQLDYATGLIPDSLVRRK